jgi:hypothetical protein
MKKIIVNIALILCLCSCVTKTYSQDPKEKIKNDLIGAWVLDDDSSIRIVYDVNNNKKIYLDNILLDTDKYTITETCETETLNNGQYFIKSIDSEGEYAGCEIIEALSEENGVITLSLTSDRGQHQLLTKQP